MQEYDELIQEGSYLFRCLFGMTPHPVLLQRYAAAHVARAFAPDALWQARLRLMRCQNMDAEALEFVWRMLYGDNPLTVKAGMLAYLAECQPEYWTSFDAGTVPENRVYAFTGALCGLIRAGLRTVVCASKGFYLTRKIRDCKE